MKPQDSSEAIMAQIRFLSRPPGNHPVIQAGKHTPDLPLL
jgi:hypothetical protein